MTDQHDHLPRGVVYRWLAQFYMGSPSRAHLERYRQDDGREFLAACKTIHAVAPFAVLLEGMVAPEVDLEEAQEQLASAFCRAFDVGGPRSAPPYASVYDDRGLLYQQPTRDMNRVLDDLQMSLPEGINEPADHLGIQINVLAEFMDREISGTSTSAARKLFLKNHLLSWLPAFSRRCDGLRHSRFYGVLTRTVLELARSDSEAEVTLRKAV